MTEAFTWRKGVFYVITLMAWHSCLWFLHLAKLMADSHPSWGVPRELPWPQRNLMENCQGSLARQQVYIPYLKHLCSFKINSIPSRLQTPSFLYLETNIFLPVLQIQRCERWSRLSSTSELAEISMLFLSMPVSPFIWRKLLNIKCTWDLEHKEKQTKRNPVFFP